MYKGNDEARQDTKNRKTWNTSQMLFVEDDAGYLVEQRDKEGNVQLVKDTDTDRVLPTDYITEAEAETYQIPKKVHQPIEDDAETISSTSTADYDQEEVETSLSTIADAFHTMGQEYETFPM